MNLRVWSRCAGSLLLMALAVLMVTANASAEWKEKVLYSFQGGSDGYTPAGGVVFDKAGNLYGVNTWGGTGGCPDPGCGTVFELSPPVQKGGAWTETTIYAFQGVLGSAKDGITPEGGIIIDQAGNLYGTTSLGGNGPCILLGSHSGCGIVYELSPPKQKGGQWTETILYNFQGGTDGYFPWGDLAFDGVGTLYGATQFGGGKGTTCNHYYGGNCGTVFKLSPSRKGNGKWTERILHSFGGGTDGANPNGFLILNGGGVVYGLTTAGGNQNCNYGSGRIGCGTAFRLKPPTKGNVWNERVIHRFDRTSSDGGNPMAGLVFNVNGSLCGTTLNGGPGQYGTIFALSPSTKGVGPWNETLLHGFKDDEQGAGPESGVIFDAKGDLWGTTFLATNRSAQGNVFRMKPPSQKDGKWTFSVVHTFSGSPDGAAPSAGLVLGTRGRMFSTTVNGGSGQSCQGGCGTVFEVSP